MGKFWNDKGIEDGNKIGILTSNNMIIMPIVLSLDSYKCQIEFLIPVFQKIILKIMSQIVMSSLQTKN